MDLFGTKRRAKDLAIAEASHHQMLETDIIDSNLRCSCGWTGPRMNHISLAEKQVYFASAHLREASSDRKNRRW